MSNYPQGDAFINLLIAAMEDATRGKLTQLQTQFQPEGTKRLEVVRIVVIPEKMAHSWPSAAPAGTPFS